jgi:hypothetical protein
MEGNSVTTRHGNWLKEQLYLDHCVTDYVIVQRNKERTFKNNKHEIHIKNKISFFYVEKLTSLESRKIPNVI